MSDEKKTLKKKPEPRLTEEDLKRGFKLQLTTPKIQGIFTVDAEDGRFVLRGKDETLPASILAEKNVSAEILEPKHRVVFKDDKGLDGVVHKLVHRVGGGEVIVRFDHTPYPEKPDDVACPHFLEMKWATGCPFNCAWCYLQGTLRIQGTDPKLKAMGRTLNHLRALFKADTTPELLNAGEISDSIIYPTPEMAKELKVPTSVPLIAPIVKEFETQDRHRLLLLSKNTNVDWFIRNSNRNIQFSFSINASEVAKRFERAPPPLARIEAAKTLHEVGYPIRIRLDPIVPIEGWQKHYGEIIQKLVGAFDPARITIGSLRALSSTVANSKDKSWTKYCTEATNFGKRMPMEERLAVYRHVMSVFLDFGFRKVAICKETIDVHERLGMNWKALECNCTW